MPVEGRVVSRRRFAQRFTKNTRYVGPVFATSVNLTILQLEKGILPIYQR
jgi:hypothetical protein